MVSVSPRHDSGQSDMHGTRTRLFVDGARAERDVYHLDKSPAAAGPNETERDKKQYSKHVYKGHPFLF